MKNLRKWQVEHLKEVLEHFSNKNRIWLSQVVTGGGKTRFGCHVGASLLDSGAINRIIVLTPGVGISDGWVRSFNQTIGSLGCYNTPIRASSESIFADDVNVIVSTYHGAGKIEGSPSTLVILDEIHHAEREASWGIQADAIAGNSRYTLALTGTPWMTRGRIALLDKNGYYNDENTIKPDLTYSYAADLKADPDERATVPLRCTFFESSTQELIDSEEGVKRLGELKLHSVTDDNLEAIIALADKYVPLRPHVTIEDNTLSKNAMARDLLGAAMAELDMMSESEVFRRSKKRPMGLVTCSSIAEANRVGEYMAAYDVTVEVIHSDDERAADRLRVLSSGKEQNPPQWLVTVGMVSEGVDIPAIKVVACLNQITTMLFLIQLIGRALRRIPASGGYLDKTLTETTARLFAPAHPRIVKVGTELERIGNQAIKERKKEPEGGNGGGTETPQTPSRYETSSDGATVFYRGAPVHDADLIRKLNAVQADQDAMEALTPVWLDLVHQWIVNGAESRAVEEVDKTLKEFNIEWGSEAKNFKEGLDYDVERGLLKREATRTVQLIRFSHSSFKYMSDAEAFPEVRKRICNSALGQFKKVDKMTLEELRKFVTVAKRIYHATMAQEMA